MAFIILNFHDQLILTVCGWLNNPSVSEIFPRNSLLLQRDRRPLWKVEMVNLNPLLLLGAGLAARMADNKHLLKGFFCFQCVNPHWDYSSAHTSNFPVEEGKDVCWGHRFCRVEASALRRSLCDYREHLLCRCRWRNRLQESAETPPANPCKAILNCFWLSATRITYIFQIHLSLLVICFSFLF